VKSNLSVGLPYDLQIYENDSFSPERQTRVEENDPIYQAIAMGWSDALRAAFQKLPSYSV
jgi:putative proteasome-type protease